MQLRQRLTRMTQRGDTIVEVLICIAVIGLILGGAFVLTNRSLQGTRAAQERLNGIKLVESQLEQIKNLAGSTQSATLFGAPASFCINNSEQIKVSTDASCTVGVDGNPSTKQPNFSISASRSGNTFTVKTVWDDVRGDGKDNVEMKYNVYQ